MSCHTEKSKYSCLYVTLVIRTHLQSTQSLCKSTTFPWDGESAQLKPQLIIDVPNKEKITLNRPTISLPIAERAIKTLGVTNCMDFFEEICSIMPRQQKDLLLHCRRPESGLATYKEQRNQCNRQHNNRTNTQTNRKSIARYCRTSIEMEGE
jgi:hypothetical protein